MVLQDLEVALLPIRGRKLYALEEEQNLVEKTRNGIDEVRSI